MKRFDVRIGERIKKARVAIGFSQGVFASRLGISQSAVARIESGQQIVPDKVLDGLCNLFNINLDWLNKGKEPIFKSAQILKDIANPEDKKFETTKLLYQVIEKSLSNEEVSLRSTVFYHYFQLFYLGLCTYKTNDAEYIEKRITETISLVAEFLRIEELKNLPDALKVRVIDYYCTHYQTNIVPKEGRAKEISASYKFVADAQYKEALTEQQSKTVQKQKKDGI